MMKPFRFFAALLVLVISTSAAFAEPRIALIVGNGDYTSVTPLDNAVPDAQLMAQTLRDQRFVVTLATDVDQVALIQAISQFGRDLRAAGKDATGLFYYAGHAVQSFGTNYLVPTDASLTDAADLSLVAVQADAVIRQMRSASNKTNIVILDACRNNPFKAIRDLNDNGLAEMNAPTGTFLSYSTAPGSVALDGLDGNSPFTKALSREIPTSGLPIERTFKNVRVAVIEETNGQQTPWDTSSLTSEFFFEPKEQLTPAELQEQQLWSSVNMSDDPIQVMLFLRNYPGGRFEQDARALLSRLVAAEIGSPDASVSEEPAAQAPDVEVLPTILEPVIEAPKPEVAVAPVTEPTASEVELIGAAQSSGTAQDYQAYLDAFPEGVYAELAVFELSIIKDREVQANETPEPVPTGQDQEPVETAALDRAERALSLFKTDLTYSTPFPAGSAPLQGKSIEELVKGNPAYPPIEGLPEEIWKGQKCTNCHNWTREALCTQGKTYASANTDQAVDKLHPYGGTFKQGLKRWASEGCQ